MPVRLKSIPDAYWLRLAAVEHTSRISMSRQDQWEIVGANKQSSWSGIESKGRHRVAWAVRIFKRNAGVHDIIDRSAPHLADAMLLAIEEAERRYSVS